MKAKMVAILLALFGNAALLAGQSPSPLQAPLHRQYHEGETLVYHMNGINEAWQYSIEADGVVKKDPSGSYFEEFRWSKLESGGQPMPLTPQTADFRQRISLDPSLNPSIPDLSKVDPKIIGPITDLLTFYSDLWLTIKTGQLNKPGDHFYFKYGVPSSWADGNYVLLGQSAVDFDLTWKSTNAADQTAVLLVRHVPPEKSTLTTTAAWMQTPVGAKPNNWATVQKTQDGKFSAAVGEETYNVEIKISLKDGRILSANLDNIVNSVERTCEDRELTKCSDPTPHQITRKIDISLVR